MLTYVERGWVTNEQVTERADRIRGIAGGHQGLRKAAAIGMMQELFAMAMEAFEQDAFDITEYVERMETVRRQVSNGLAVAAGYDLLLREQVKGVAA